jgi:hypothetical protein
LICRIKGKWLFVAHTHGSTREPGKLHITLDLRLWTIQLANPSRYLFKPLNVLIQESTTSTSHGLLPRSTGLHGSILTLRSVWCVHMFGRPTINTRNWKLRMSSACPAFASTNDLSISRVCEYTNASCCKFPSVVSFRSTHLLSICTPCAPLRRDSAMKEHYDPGKYLGIYY